MNYHRPFCRRRFLQMGTGCALAFTPLGNGTAVAADAGNGPVRFGAIADCQYADASPVGTRYYRASRGKLQAAVRQLNAADLDFVIHLGDFIDHDFASFDHVLPILDRCRTKTHHVLGNHDFAVADSLKSQVPAKLGLKRPYYHFACRRWRMVVLDGNDISFQAHIADSPARQAAAHWLRRLKETNAPNAQPWNGAIGPAQMQWLDTTLRHADQADERVIVFCHFPVYPPNAHNLWNSGRVIERLEAHPSVVAFINGHNHAGNYAVKGAVAYVTLQGMVETPDTTAWGVAGAEPDRLTISGQGRVPRREITFGA